ncbi:unnamed protein product [Amoebophrya sp. A120]|nr:unnamed protein product [Amoebophrya sp. A120]|eukprot:GSA120T00005460001.1
MRDNGALAAGRRTHQRTRPKQSTAVSTTLLVSPLNGGAEQKFPVYIDTRSPALFVPDASCGDCPSSVTKFDSGEDTAKKKVKSVTVGRLGVVSGYAVETKVAVSSSVFVNKQPVLSAYELPQNLLPSGITGYLGLGKLSLPLAKDSFLLNLLLPDRSGMSGAVTEGYFYVDYQNSAAPELVLTTSKPDASRYDANFGANWLPTLEVERYSQWFVLANSLTVANRTTSKKTDAVIVSLDFGAPSAILAPSDAYTSLMESITALPGVTNPLWVPCASVPELPTLTFDILHEQYSLTGAEYTDPDKDHKQCHLRVSADPGAPYWTLGAQFHQKYAVTYDFTQGRIALPRSSVPSWFGDNWLAVVIPGSFGVLLTAFLLFVRSQKHAAGSQFRSSPQLPAAAGSGP